MNNTISLCTRNALLGLFLSVTLLSFQLVFPFQYVQAQSAHQTGQNDYFPGGTWLTATPKAVGMDMEKLQKIYKYCAKPSRNTRAYMIIKDGYIVEEAYFNDTDLDTPFEGFSITKTIVSALIGMAIDKGYIYSLDDEIGQYFQELENDEFDPKLQDISIRQLLTMTTGLMWNEDEMHLSTLSDIFKNDIFNLKFYADDFLDYVLDKPVIETPGSTWNYTSGAPILLSGIIESTTGGLTAEFAGQHLFSPLGIDSFYWAQEPGGQTNGAWGLSLTTRDYAKFGYLYLQNGRWQNEQLLPSSWVAASQIPARDDASHFGFLWWLADRYPETENTNIPPDTYMAVGLFQRYIIVIPSYNLLLVRMGDGLDTGEDGWDTAAFISQVIDAVDVVPEDCDLPPSTSTLIAPWGHMASAWPVFKWNTVSCATWYKIFVRDSSEGKIYAQWYPAADICSGGSCTVTLESELLSDNYEWWIQTWNDNGYGDWSSGMSFTVGGGNTPRAVTLTSPSDSISDTTPTYTWNAVANSTWYQLWVNDSTGTPITQWYTTEEAGCESGTGNCSITPTTALESGSCNWWVRGWNSDGNGAWSSGMSFTVSD